MNEMHGTWNEKALLNKALLNLYSLNLMEPLMNSSFLPFTTSSMLPANIMYILNDVTIHNRKNILEFGAGISTIMIGRLVKKNALEARLVSVEHDEKWIEVLQAILNHEGLDNIVTMIHAPLAKCSLAVDNNLWYNTAILDTELMKHPLFDLVIVDGPPAMELSLQKSRYPAFPYINDRLAAEFSFYLDDIERIGENWAIGRWCEQFNMKFSIKNGSLGRIFKGHSFNLDIV